MKIYSIKEIVNATNNLLKVETETLKKNNKSKKVKLPPETENKIIESRKSILKQKSKDLNKEKPLILDNEVSKATNNKINSFNYKIKIKPEVKDHMINELYLYLKKKVRKNTLGLIIDEQLEIKNLKNKINLLNQRKLNLENTFKILKDNYEYTLNENENLKINKEQLNNQIKELKINNELLQKDLNEVVETKELLDVEINELKSKNQLLHKSLDEINKNKEILDTENKELKDHLHKTKLDLKDNIEKNRSYEINNSELKNTVSRYIVNTKKIQEKLNLAEQSNNLKLDTQIEKVKFYQEENIRLSSELLAAQKKNVMIKENLTFIETEKEKISNKIKELNKSIDEKTNIIPSNFVKENIIKTEEKIETLNDKEQKSLDEVINKIFSKI